MNLKTLGLAHPQKDRIFLDKGFVISVALHYLYQHTPQQGLAWTALASSNWHS